MVLGLFGDPVKRKEKQIQKHLKNLKQPYAQPEIRRESMEALLKMEDIDSLKALLERFSYNCDGNISDESEKKDLIAELVKKGDKSIIPLKEYIAKSEKIVHASEALKQIIGDSAFREFIIQVLQKFDPDDHASAARKIQIISLIAEMKEPELAKYLYPFLRDFHDDVRFITIEAIEKIADKEAKSFLLPIITSDEASIRVQLRAAQELFQLKLDVRELKNNMSEIRKR